MLKFILVCCYNGEFEPLKSFESYAAAHASLLGDYADMKGSYSDEDDGEVSGEIDASSAWFEAYENKCYWKIFELPAE